MLESVTQGCSAWLRFEPDVVALSILLLAVGTTSSRDELIERVSVFAKSKKKSRECKPYNHGRPAGGILRG